MAGPRGIIIGAGFTACFAGSEKDEMRGGGTSEGVTGKLSETGSESSLDALSALSAAPFVPGGIWEDADCVGPLSLSLPTAGGLVSRSALMTQTSFERISDVT